ncbi:PAS domain S-box protein [Motilibacter aurantiacus]|uniref:PAS domain S-box protein n=1 Tax=Motilibacter aurantiacus TaxID=2714955 RepID=UPI00140851FE|nr:PAS domain S-box protein [Motilibacter aurantiacus]NHC46708.1 PAS domain S-box protein [Motilibacter aurantiacus]
MPLVSACAVPALVAAVLHAAGKPLGQIPAFMPGFLATVLVLDVITVVLLLSQYVSGGRARLLVLSWAYAWSALIVVPHALVFSGLFTAQGLLGATPSSAPWLWTAWHVGLPALIGLALAPWPARLEAALDALQHRGLVVLASLTGLAVAAGGVTGLVTAGARHLPVIISNGSYAVLTDRFGPWIVGVNVVALGAAVAGVLARGSRRGLETWAVVAVVASCGDVVLTLWATGRFTAGWYAARLLALAAALVVLASLLREITTLYSRLRAHAETLAEQYEQLQAAHALQEQLAAREAELRHVLAASSDAFVAVDEDERIIAWNPAAVRLFGWSAEQALGRTLRATILPTRLASAHHDGFARFIRSGAPTLAGAVEVPARHRDGAELVVELTVTPVLVGGRWRVYAAIRDVTERRRLEQELRSLAGIVSGARDAIVSVDLEGTITSWNRAAEQLYGYGADAVVGAQVATLAPAGDDQLAGWLQRAVAGEHVDPLDSTGRRRDGSTVEVSVAVSPVLDAAGEVVGASIASRDITERQADRRRLAAANADLGAANSALQQVNAELDRFTASVAHDLKNPITTVAGYAELLHDLGDFDADSVEATAVAAIQRGADRMRALIDGLLAYARASSAPLALEPVDVNQVVEEVALDLAPLLERSGGALRAGALPIVAAHPVLLRQVLANLIGNAVKYVAPGVPPRVDLTARPTGDGWAIEIADNGIGIPADARDKVFRMFHREPTSGYEGTGIGLATCRRIVERHAGRLWIDDRPADEEGAPAQGSVLHLWLPLASTGPEPVGPPAAALRASA